MELTDEGFRYMNAADPKKTATTKMWELQVLKVFGPALRGVDLEDAGDDEEVACKDG